MLCIVCQVSPVRQCVHCMLCALHYLLHGACYMLHGCTTNIMLYAAHCMLHAMLYSACYCMLLAVCCLHAACITCCMLHTSCCSYTHPSSGLACRSWWTCKGALLIGSSRLQARIQRAWQTITPSMVAWNNAMHQFCAHLGSKTPIKNGAVLMVSDVFRSISVFEA